MANMSRFMVSLKVCYTCLAWSRRVQKEVRPFSESFNLRRFKRGANFMSTAETWPVDALSWLSCVLSLIITIADSVEANVGTWLRLRSGVKTQQLCNVNDSVSRIKHGERSYGIMSKPFISL